MKGNTDNAVIYTCTTLRNHVDAAQKKMGTSLPVYEIDKELHLYPQNYWDQVFAEMEKFDADTVLLAMGTCGGNCCRVPFPKRSVMPVADDCITMLMHTREAMGYNLKEAGHFYLTENEEFNSIRRIRNDYFEQYGEETGKWLLDEYFHGYKSVDIIDTGEYDSYSDAYEERARKEAAVINVSCGHVPGSNIMLEKLVTGDWDDMFFVLEKGEVMTEEYWTARQRWPFG